MGLEIRSCIYITMIDISVYRFRVGVHNANTGSRYLKRLKSGIKASSTGSIFDQYNSYISSRILFYVCYILFIIHIFGTALLMEVSLSSRSCPLYDHDFRTSVSSFAIAYNKLFLIYFVIHILKIYYSRNYCFNELFQFCSKCCDKNIIFRGKLGKCLSVMFVWLFSLNLFLIIVVNPGIVNPGPSSHSTKFSIFYCNVQGLIPFGDLANANPSLHHTKLHELNHHISINKPDIIIYNETWLKGAILDSEVVPTNSYKVFRLDRSTQTHPPDPSNPRKF